MREKPFQDDVIKWLNGHKVYHIRTQMGEKSGIPDILCCMFGKFVGLELKRPDKKGKPTLQQIKICNDININGGVGIFIDSIDKLEILYNQLKEEEHCGQ